MFATDYSPPSVPTIDQQRDALRKGLGRAVLWAKAGRLADDPLLAACLEEQRYDTQCESQRGEWLWQLIRIAGAVERFREPVLQALLDLKDERSANQLCELGCHYALAGDRRFRDRLYEIVERKPWPDDGRLGEDEIVRIDGEAGFLLAARVRGSLLPTDDREWEDRWLVSAADEILGEGRALALLQGSSEPSIQTFYERLGERERLEAPKGPEVPYEEGMRAITLDQVLSEAQSADCSSFRLRGWGKYADEADLARVVRHISSTSDPSVIANLLWVFRFRPAPQFVEPLIEMAQHPDAEVRRRAVIVLEQIEHPLVRHLAVTRLGQPDHAHRVVRLFRANFQPGDEQRIVDAIEIPEDQWDRHSLLMAVIGVLEDQPESHPSALGLIAYALTPCQNCRARAAEILIDEGIAPDWMWEECHFDSNEEFRELVTQRPSPEDSEDPADRPD